MKKIIIIGLAVAAFNGYAQTISNKTAKEIYAPNFLVHQQLTPELIKVEYAGSLSSSILKSNQQDSPFKVNSLTVSGYPLTLINRPHRQMYVGFGYGRDTYNSSTRYQFVFLNQTYQSGNINLFLNTRIKGNFYWFSYLQAGVQGSNPFNEVKKSHTEIVLNKINYKVNRNMNVGAGIAYSSNLGKPVVMPAITFVYSQPHYLINIDFPVKAEIEGIFTAGKWRPVAGVFFPSTTYNVRNTDNYFQTSGLVGYIGTSYRILDFLYLHAKWQTGLGETLKLGSRSEREKMGTVDGQDRIVMSLNIQVARIIPDMVK